MMGRSNVKRFVAYSAAGALLAALAIAAHLSASAPALAATAPVDGKAIFATNCSSCHASAGQGAPGLAPPLAKNPYVTGDPKKVCLTVLHGMTGKIVVHGTSYDGQMPPWKDALSNAEIAAVVSYVRTSWGNKASKVTEKQVKSLK
jgi:cbb3-type cytochrome c oxidase subunit III